MGLFAFWPKRQFLVFLLAVPFVGCGGKAASSSPEPSLPQVGFQLNQTSVSIPAGGQQQFTAVVHGTSNISLSWSVDSISGGNSTVGAATAAGLIRLHPGAGCTRSLRRAWQTRPRLREPPR